MARKRIVVEPRLTSDSHHVDVGGTQRVAPHEEKPALVPFVALVAVGAAGPETFDHVVDLGAIVHGDRNVENGLGVESRD